MNKLQYNTDSSCPQFNNKDEQIDFSKFPPATNLPNFEFYSTGVLRIGRFDENGKYEPLITEEQLRQAYTRNELNNDRIQGTEDSYEVNDFVTLVEPPKISSNDSFIEGRGRIQAAMNREEEFIPVFIYDPLTSYHVAITLVAGLLENNPKPQNSKVPNNMLEWALTIRALVELGPENGGIMGDAKSITDQLISLNWTVRWPRESDRTKIRKQIDKELKALKNGDTMVHRRKEIEVNAWMRENYSGSKNYVLVCMDNLRYARQIIFEKVFPSVENGSDPVSIILWTKRHTSSDAINNCNKFVKYLDESYESIFDHVGTMQLRDPEISSFIFDWSEEKQNLITEYNLETPPYIFSGAIPQIEDYHNLNSKKLVTIKDYGKRMKNPNSNKRKKKPTVTDFTTINESLGVAAT